MRKIIVIFAICLVSKAWGNKISDAFEALSVFDYFKAKQLFYKVNKKYPCESSYGLATIFYRNDNPFSNIDSAAKYIAISKKQFTDTITFSNYHINSQNINELARKISYKGFSVYSATQSIKDLNYFLTHFYFSNDTLLNESFYKRDELVLNLVATYQSSDSAKQFLLRYPEAWLYTKAQALFYDFQFVEKAPQKNINQLKYFIKKFPQNPHISEAENTLFSLTQEFHSPDSVYEFIKQYSSNLTNESAWKLLYSLSVKQYSKEELTDFINKYPDYPYNESVLKEISLSQNILIPVKNINDKYGFIDTLGNWIIQPYYDDAAMFGEGFASICKNDSCFYINKEGKRIFNQFFIEAEDYKDGIAIVKKDSAYFLINRSGQLISKGYQDINESSHQLYVCKSNNMYGAINAKGNIIIPFEYTKLGNFKNKFAYYLAKQYGLVDIHNAALPAMWDWISDVDSNSIAVVKKENQFGLMDVMGEVILPTTYDYITHCIEEIYLVVKNKLYGFYNIKEKCFITSVDYDYNSSFETSYYTNGKNFKLIKNDDVALADANGGYNINFGAYSNFFFAKDGITRIQKNNKFGFVDRKLKAVTSVEFDKAKDFENSRAIVSKGSSSSLIDKSGKIIYTIKNAEILSAGNKLYFVKQNDLLGLIDSSGKQIISIEFESIENVYHHFYICTKNNELYLFNPGTKILKKL